MWCGLCVKLEGVFKKMRNVRFFIIRERGMCSWQQKWELSSVQLEPEVPRRRGPSVFAVVSALVVQHRPDEVVRPRWNVRTAAASAAH